MRTVAVGSRPRSAAEAESGRRVRTWPILRSPSRSRTTYPPTCRCKSCNEAWNVNCRPSTELASGMILPSSSFRIRRKSPTGWTTASPTGAEVPGFRAESVIGVDSPRDHWSLLLIRGSGRGQRHRLLGPILPLRPFTVYTCEAAPLLLGDVLVLIKGIG